jgi:hypothetical protein
MGIPTYMQQEGKKENKRGNWRAREKWNMYSHMTNFT